MSTIQISNLTFSYDSSPQTLFEDLNLTLDTNWKLGLIGRNGKGKSTFLHLMAGQESFLGSIQAQVGFEYYPPKLSDLNQLPMDVFHELCPFQEDWEFLSELNQLDAKLVSEVYTRPFSSFSQGEQGKLLMAILFCKPKTFLLLDEPETSLDYEGRKTLVKYLKGKQGFILVSHDRLVLDELVDHILCIEEDGMSLQAGNYSSWHTNQEAKAQELLQRNVQLHREIERLKQASDQTKNWAQKAESQKKQAPRQKNQAKEFIDRGFQSHKAAKVMKRSKTLQKRQEKALREKKELLKNINLKEEIKMPVLASPYQTLISLEKVQVVYKEKEQSLVPHKPISFSLHPKERLALYGLNGSGKSSILKAIQGLLPYQGTINKPERLICSIVPQDVADLKGTFQDFVQAKQIDQTLFMTLLRKLGFKRETFLQDLSALSLGQKKKVVIAASLCQPAHLYIWDEPLSHLDLMSRQQIEEMIVQSEATILCIEHDERFLQAIQAQIVEVK